MKISALLLFIFVVLQTSFAQQSFSDCEDCPEMVVIPAGSVTIGSAANAAFRRDGERPLQEAVIDQPFALAITEVTVSQYRVFVEESRHDPVTLVRDGKTYLGCNYFDGRGYGFVAQHNWQNPGYPQRDDEPVVCVSWSDAAGYARWLSEKTGRLYRVPSTVEFEYAYRAGTDTPWFWGTNPDQACEFGNIADQTFARTYPERPTFGCNDGYTYTTRVKRFEPNPFGVYDIFGNAWEWTNDCWHEDLSASPVDGTTWLSEDGGNCDIRVPKGGSWLSGPSWGHAAVHSYDPAHYRSFMLGFRVAASLDE